jgi:DNA-binding CsgD family transcriptional regulator
MGMDDSPDAFRHVRTGEVLPDLTLAIPRIPTQKRMNPASGGSSVHDVLKHHMVRLLRSYCNRERHTTHLRKLHAQASTECVSRDRPPLQVDNPAPKRLSAEAIAGIIADYAAKMPVRAIARKYGINEWTVHHRLKRTGVMKRPYAIQPDTVNAILRLHAKGCTNVAIAHSVNVSETSVRNILKRHGSKL